MFTLSDDRVTVAARGFFRSRYVIPSGMRAAFTLIELMIVMAIIAVISAIAIPNLIESRINSNEAGAATSLRTGVFPAQALFQSGGYSDIDGDGIGEYACGHAFMAGTTPTAYAAAGTYDPAYPGMNHSGRVLALLPVQWNVPDGTSIGGFCFSLVTSPDQWSVGGGANDYTYNERYWAGFAAPANTNTGRRGFCISGTGFIFATKQSLTAAVTLTAMTSNNASFCFTSCPWKSGADLNTANMTQYLR